MVRFSNAERMSRITQIYTPLSVKFVGNPLGAVVFNDFIAFT